MSTKPAVHIIVILVVFVALVGYAITRLNQPQNQDLSPKPTPEDADNLRRVADIDNLVSIEIPDNWRVDSESEFGGKPLHFRALSPQWHTETPDLMDASTHISSGAMIEIYVFDRDIGRAPDRLNMAIELTGRKSLTIDNNEHFLDVYREYDPPKEGLVLEVPFQHGSNFYTFRLAYNPKTYPEGEDMFIEILQSVRFTE